MAKMWPKKLPEWVRRDERRSAEVKVYGKLKEQLSEEWSVFYSRPWLGLGVRGEELDGEADFIVVHPYRGLLFLEIKGGRIDYSSETEQWYTTDRNNAKFKIKNPVEQSKKCKHQIRTDLISEYSGTWHLTRFRHGVVFPDAKLDNPITHLAGAPLEIFCFASEFSNSFSAWVERRLPQLSQIESEKRLPDSGMSQLETLVASSASTSRSKSSQIGDKQNEIEILFTGAQRILLAQILGRGALFIEGAAGTGKTLIAIEAAMRFAKQGIKVSVLCVGSLLAESLRNQCKSNANISVDTVDNWLSTSAAYIPSEVVIIDEAQDIIRGAWDKIATMLPKQFYIFADSNQKVYDHDSIDFASRFNCEQVYLHANLRNTLPIARLTESLYEGPLVHALGPEGPEVKVTDCSEVDMPNSISNKVRELVLTDSYIAGDITVLVASETQVIPIKQLLNKFCDEQGIAKIKVETVTAFKGLESPVVVLAASKELVENAELSYVAVSRAAIELHVVGPEIQSLVL